MTDLSFNGEHERSIADTYELPDHQFQGWWNLLLPEDKEEFKWAYHGDELLARFLCALDLLMTSKIKGGDHTALIQLAYHIAAKPYATHRVELSDNKLRTLALQAYQHPAVQQILDRVRLRSRMRERNRIENLALEEAEQMLKDASQRNENDQPLFDMKDRKLALDTALKLMEMTDTEQARQRQERSRKAFQMARQRAMEGETNESPAVMRATLKALASKLGPEEVRKALTALTDDD